MELLSEAAVAGVYDPVAQTSTWEGGTPVLAVSCSAGTKKCNTYGTFCTTGAPAASGATDRNRTTQAEAEGPEAIRAFAVGGRVERYGFPDRAARGFPVRAPAGGSVPRCARTGLDGGRADARAVGVEDVI